LAEAADVTPEEPCEKWDWEHHYRMAGVIHMKRREDTG
jgi:hypothetical protein